jgi:hypothetical protein
MIDTDSGRQQDKLHENLLIFQFRFFVHNNPCKTQELLSSSAINPVTAPAIGRKLRTRFNRPHFDASSEIWVTVRVELPFAACINVALTEFMKSNVNGTMATVKPAAPKKPFQ